MGTFLFCLFVFGVIAKITSRINIEQHNKIVDQSNPPKPRYCLQNGQWFVKDTDWDDYGPTVEILGKTFTKNQNGYSYNGLIFGNHKTQGNYFGAGPYITLTREEFLARLEK